MIEKKFESGWASKISGYYSDVKFSTLGIHIAQLRKRFKIYPESSDVFKAFSLTPYEKVKVVILGQDPYHNGSADGLAFSQSKSTVQCAPSLQLILDEIKRCFPEMDSEISHGKLDPWDLSRWAEQGVLLLNSSLTVRAKQPGAHIGLWMPFTKAVIRAINDRQDIVWLLLGREAQKYMSLIANPSHAIVGASHPAADLYSGENKFFGSSCFLHVNEALAARNKETIVW